MRRLLLLSGLLTAAEPRPGGLAVIAGPVEPAQAIHLAQGRWVLALDTDAQRIAALRRAAAAAGIHGTSFWADTADGAHLPLDDGAADLVLATADVPEAECLRVLGPGDGVLRRPGRPDVVRPGDPGRAGWTHRFGDTGNNPFIPDQRLAAPFATRWLGRPIQQLEREAIVLADDDRIIALGRSNRDYKPTTDRFNNCCAYAARTGALLWRRNLPEPYRTGTPLAALRQRELFVGLDQAVAVLDAQTGTELRRLAVPGAVVWLADIEAGLLVATGTGAMGAAFPQTPRTFPTAKDLIRANADTPRQAHTVVALSADGARRWTLALEEPVDARAIATAHGRLVVWSPTHGARAYATADASPLWSWQDATLAAQLTPTGTEISADNPHRFTSMQKHTLLTADLALLGAQSSAVQVALDAATGALRWQGRQMVRGPAKYVLPSLVDDGGRLWSANGILDAQGGTVAALRLGEGCGGITACPGAVFSSRGVAWTPAGPAGKDAGLAFLARPPCDVGWILAEGRAIAASGYCTCASDARGWQVIGSRTRPIPATPPLVVPAGLRTQPSALPPEPPRELAPYLPVHRRSDAGPVFAQTDGLVGAHDGTWQVLLGAGVVAEPVVSDDLVWVGALDGSITCLALADGALRWTVRPVPDGRRLPLYGMLASPWPVLGVAVADGRLAVAMGASPLDGARLLLLEPASGQTLISHDVPATGSLADAGQPWAPAGTPARHAGAWWFAGTRGTLMRLADDGTATSHAPPKGSRRAGSQVRLDAGTLLVGGAHPLLPDLRPAPWVAVQP
jgi:outer membrane protein assembly factor BamB